MNGFDFAGTSWSVAAPAMLWGLLGIAIPLVIHFFHRRRADVVDWGAMQFLESVVRLNRRRLQLRNWLLLLLRCAIPILLALCLARPVVTGWQQPRGDQPVAMVVIVDTSYSMSAGREDGQRRIDAAVEAARRVTGELGRGSEITVLTSDGEVRRGDPQSIRMALDELTVGGPPLEIDRLVSQALRLAAESSLAHRQIVLLSDNVASDYTQPMLHALPAIGLTRFVPEIAHLCGVAVPVFTSFIGHRLWSFRDGSAESGEA